MILEHDEPSAVELRLLRTFEAIVAAGSFVRASEALGMAQSTVTVHVQQLERGLNTMLFDRAGRRPVLTEAGRTLHEHAAPLLQQAALLEQTLAEFASGEAGQVRLGAIEPAASLRLPALLVRYCRVHPKVRLALEVGGGDGIAVRVSSGELDLGLAPPPDPSLGLAYEALFEEELVLLVPDGHPLANAPEITPTAIATQRLLVSESTCSYRRLIERTLSERGTPVYDTLELGSMLAICRAVAAGLGPGIVPRIAVPTDLPGIVARDVCHLRLNLPVGIVRRRDAPPPTRAVENMLTLLRARLRSDALADARPAPRS